MSQLNELYQEVILDHNKQPRNFHAMEHPDRKLEGYNPLCGDRCTVFLKLDDQKTIQDVSFIGSGCAISKASMSIMTTTVKGKKFDEVEELFEKFHRMVMGKMAPEEIESLGKLKIFAGVSEFPARVKCASLAWHTVKGALEGQAAPVSTEKEGDTTP